MHVFKDRDGKDWTIDVNVDALRRVKAALSVDLMELVSDSKFIDRLIGDPCFLVDILYVLCKPQADAAGVSDESFGQRMGGDSIDVATTALLEDFVDFFPTRKRGILRVALAKLKTIESGMLDLAENTINDPALDAMITDALAKMASKPATAVQSADESQAA